MLTLGWSYKGTDMSPVKYVEGIADATELLTEFAPPNFDQVGMYWDTILETIQMVIWVSLLATFVAVPFAFWVS